MKKQAKSKPFKWKPFSKKQMQIMTWWCEGSPVRECDGIIADGSVRSGKTVSMSASFIMWAMSSFDDTDFAICGKTVGSVRRNVIKTLKQQMASLGYEYTERRSDNLIVVTHKDKTNYFYLFGGKDESSQDLIQGMTLGGVLFDEVALMPQSFVSQAEARCSVEGSKLWYNCNPKGPTHYFKKEYINTAKEKRLIYLHFTMDDNLTLSDKMKERYKRQFSGVFYDRNILGLWVTAEGKIYISFDAHNVIGVEEWYERNDNGWKHPLRKKLVFCTIGVDFGGNGSATTFTLSGFTKALRDCVILKEKYIKKEITPTELEREFVYFCRACMAEYPNVTVAYCDSAEQVLIRGLRAAVVRAGVPLSIKNALKGEIIDRIRFATSMFAQRRLHVLSDCTKTIEAYTDAVWDDKHPDERLDDGTTNIDSLDSAEYSQEPYMRKMIDLSIYN